MTALAAAIVAVAIIAADLAGDLWLDDRTSDAWGRVNTLWLLYAAWIIAREAKR